MKGIIVVDIPRTCENCILSEKTWYGNAMLITCPFMPYQVERDNKQNEEKFCPIKPIPEKKQVCGRYPQSDGITPSYKIGWNKCIDEILKGE